MLSKRLTLFAGLISIVSAIACGLPADPRGAGGSDAETDAGINEAPPIVILMIGDGMGKPQLEAASYYRHGAPGALFLQSLPSQGEVTTASLSGTTDSAAAATAMATGEFTYNTYIGVDRAGGALETLVETANARGIATGIVTTSYLPHATPASFTAHHGTRHEPIDIANDQAKNSGADVMLGGGRQYFLPAGPGSLREDQGLLTSLAAKGYTIAQSAAELEDIRPGETEKVLGIFSDEHMDYVRDREGDEQPSLPSMSLKALDLLSARGTGVFLMVEGARIDMASHENDLQRTIDETLAFDDAVRAVSKWAEGKDNVTILVTADHECGGLEIIETDPAETLPTVQWRWGMHTNARVGVFGSGPQSERFADEVHDHRWVHASLRAAVTGETFVAPNRVTVADGHLEDLRYQVAKQENPSGFGRGYNELNAMHVDADEHGLTVGISGVFEAENNAIILFVDTDVGTGAGLLSMDSLSDQTGLIDSLLSNLNINPAPSSGFAPEFAVASIGAMDPHREDLWEEAGLRGLVSPHGAPESLGWYGVAMNYGETVRANDVALSAEPGEGFEVHLPWSLLYPDHEGRIPPGAQVGLSTILVNTSGTFVSNQALPSFAPGTENPGVMNIALPGPVVVPLDSNDDAKVDADLLVTIVE